MPINHIFTNIKNPELGYYSCNGQLFDSKIKACIYATSVKKPLKWHFNDEVFDRYPWHIEPDENLDYLYDKRAKELREKYDYIILAFSGGGDSNNILESFLRQNLHIDEIITNTMTEYNSVTVFNEDVTDSWNEGAEFKFQTLPRLEHVKKVSPKTKITIIDLSKCVVDFFNKQKDESWLDYSRERLNISGLLRHNFIYFNEVRKTFDKDKKIAMVLGIEKPRTWINKDGIFKMFFGDQAVNIATVQEFISDYTNAKVENFYWNPDCAVMIAKQVHTIKRFLEKNPQLRDCWTSNLVDNFKTNYRLIHERVLRPVLYSSWRSSYWQANKSTLDWYSEIDNWFLKDFKGRKEFEIWNAGLTYVSEKALNYMNKDKTNPGLVPFIKAYEIGPMNYLS